MMYDVSSKMTCSVNQAHWQQTRVGTQEGWFRSGIEWPQESHLLEREQRQEDDARSPQWLSW